MQIAGVDVGGTNIRAGLVADDHAVSSRDKVDTPGSVDEVLDAVVSLVEGLDERPMAVGVGIPGLVHGGQVVEVPNLAGWSPDTEVVGQLRDRLGGLPVAVGNDAQVGVLGEWVAGAARGVRGLLGLWLGTGVGGGLVLDGRPYTGRAGGAGEIGHVQVHPGGAMCGCGRRGCLEAYAGRRMMTAAARSMQEAGRETSLFAIADDKGKPEPTSSVWVDALDDGDAVATELFDAAVDALGIVVGSVVNLLDVERVVVGGGFAEKMGSDLADRIAAAAEPFVMHPDPDREVVAAALGDDSGLVGAAWLARGALADGAG